MKKILCLLLVLAFSAGFSQSINDYKYAIVPSKFKFLNQEDQYRINTFTKMFMEKYGFTTYFDTDRMPPEVANQNCNKVYVDVQSKGNAFMTKLIVVLRDCKNEVLFTSAEGASSEKEYPTAFSQALREAFKSFDKLGYKYNGTVTNTETVVVKTTNNGSTIQQEVIPVNSNSTSFQNVTLFAQPIENGFQVVDNTSKVMLKILKTSANNVFVAENNQGKGVLFLKNENWIFEYYIAGKLISETLKIKF
jgi:hypothetical protein